jgi:hypothetical protein
MSTLKSKAYCIVLAASVGISAVITGCNAAPVDTTPNQEAETERATVPAGSSFRVVKQLPSDPPPRPTTKEACDACQGLWAVHGIEPAESCICKTDDEGLECSDGKDCEGECIVDGDAEFHVMDGTITPPLGSYRGRCAAYDTTFGCFRHLPDGVQAQLPLLEEDASAFICVD